MGQAKLPGKKRKVTGFSVVLLLILLCAIVSYFDFKTVVVRGQSMEPTFHTGRRLLVSKAYWLVGQVSDRDIVVVSDKDKANPDGFIIKRVYKMGGETVGGLNVPRNWSLSNGPFVVPAGMVYLLGDNSAVSQDSRYFGPVTADRILGKVIVWP